MQCRKRMLGRLGVHLWNIAAVQVIDQRSVRSPNSSRCDADQIQQITRLFEIHRHAIANVVDLSQRADQQRWVESRSTVAAIGVVMTKFVVQAVFAADKRRAQCERQIVTGESRSD